MPIFNTYIGDEAQTANNATEAEDQRLRRNIQWGVVRGLFLWTLITLPISLVVLLIINGIARM
jgi:hypothetical protein